MLSLQPTRVLIDAEISNLPSNSVIATTSASEPLILPTRRSPTLIGSAPLTIIFAVFVSEKSRKISASALLFFLNGSLSIKLEFPLVTSNSARFPAATI